MSFTLARSAPRAMCGLERGHIAFEKKLHEQFVFCIGESNHIGFGALTFMTLAF
jgi:hypothetical protein